MRRAESPRAALQEEPQPRSKYLGLPKYVLAGVAAMAGKFDAKPVFIVDRAHEAPIDGTREPGQRFVGRQGVTRIALEGCLDSVKT